MPNRSLLSGECGTAPATEAVELPALICCSSESVNSRYTLGADTSPPGPQAFNALDHPGGLAFSVEVPQSSSLRPSSAS